MTSAAPDKSPDRIAGMFDAIAPRYDLLNHLLSAGIDRRWRARAIASLGLTGRETLLDVCAGTADLALAARAAPAGAARVVGVDFSAAMLSVGLKMVQGAGEGTRIALVQGDATRLPVRANSVDAAIVGFGIRNVLEPKQAYDEMARAIRPGGRLAILEFGVPETAVLGAAYRWYFTRVLPRIGRLISGHSGAYSYLPASVGVFPPPAEVVTLLRQCGFDQVRADRLTLGVVYLYTGIRRPLDASSS
jgi:demethylmenaquinone methyltransferase/2-methoxy-6-polyprenyl-1,4-benzoquinol methylase